MNRKYWDRHFHIYHLSGRHTDLQKILSRTSFIKSFIFLFIHLYLFFCHETFNYLLIYLLTHSFSYLLTYLLTYYKLFHWVYSSFVLIILLWICKTKIIRTFYDCDSGEAGLLGQQQSAIFLAFCKTHVGVIKWKHFLCYWPFVWGIPRWPVNSPHKSQWRGALMFSLIYAWRNGRVNNGDASVLRRHHAHYDVTEMPYLNTLGAYIP